MSRRQKCNDGVWLMARLGEHGEERWFFSPPCGLKKCPTCSEMARKRHVARISLAVQSDDGRELNWYFITGTARAKFHRKKMVDEGLASIRRAWSVVRKRLNRRYEVVVWVKVYERHKSGMYHLHAIVGIYGTMDKNIIKKMWFEGGGGYQVDLKRLSRHSQIKYIAKYATKSDVPIRAIEYSRNFPKLAENNPESPLNWEFLGNIDISHYIEALEQSGVIIKMMTEIPEQDE